MKWEGLDTYLMKEKFCHILEIFIYGLKVGEEKDI